MRRPNREVSIFSLSALDVLATSTGVFVLFVVILLPYYQLTEDAGAAIARQQDEAGEQLLDIELLRQSSAEDRRATAALRGDSRDMAAEALALRGQADDLRREIASIQAKLSSGAVKKARPRGNSRLQFIAKLDLVFVIDTTRSMKRTLDELTKSLKEIVAILDRLVVSLRVGVVAYRDAELGGPVTTTLKLTPSSAIDQIQGFMSGLRVADRGGRTIEEDVLVALQQTRSLGFRDGAVQQLILIGDAAAHPADQPAALDFARRFHGSSKRTLSALFIPTPAYRKYGGSDREFFADLAHAGGGEFSEHRGRMVESILLSILKKKE